MIRLPMTEEVRSTVQILPFDSLNYVQGVREFRHMCPEFHSSVSIAASLGRRQGPDSSTDAAEIA